MNTRSEVPTWAQTPDRLTDKQEAFIESLKDERELEPQHLERLEQRLKNRDLTKKQASETIEWLLEQPKKSTNQIAGDPQFFIPAGRYAVESNEGELRFYQVWRPKDNINVFRLYVLHGPDSSPVQRGAIGPIMAKIQKAGIREAAIRFGNEIGSCSNCGRRLTNRISRELGIGPVCGGRMFDDGDWKQEVKDARQRIIDRGENPEEELEDDLPL